MAPWTIGKFAQGCTDHSGAEIRATNTDIDDVCDHFAGRPAAFAGTDRFRQLLHPSAGIKEFPPSFRYSIRLPQRHVKRRPTFGGVDHFASEGVHGLILYVA